MGIINLDFENQGKDSYSVLFMEETHTHQVTMRALRLENWFKEGVGCLGTHLLCCICDLGSSPAPTILRGVSVL